MAELVASVFSVPSTTVICRVTIGLENLVKVGVWYKSLN